MNKLLIYINNRPTYAIPGITVLQACESIGISLPRFCYHDLLNIAGNCRICLVEIQNSPKPQVACGLPVINGIKIYTNSPIVKKAREAVLEFLLLNHPLDCPICDQAGQCDLQNQARRFSSLRGRFFETKRGVTDKSFGPLIKTVITRCIHCTRCVRFLSEIAGVGTLGTTLRGYNIQIGTYVPTSINSEISANIIDLCPVGALTTKPHAFKSRPWEITAIKGIDTIDSLGSHITIEVKNFVPIRIVPRPFLDINQEWITDIARFAYEGFVNNRLAFSYYSKRSKFNQFISLHSIRRSLKNYILGRKQIKIVFGSQLDLEVIQRGLFLSKTIGWDFTEEHSYKLFPTFPSFIQGISYLKDLRSIDFCLILGINPRTEASLLNVRLRKAKQSNNLITSSVGSSQDLTFKTYHFGLNYNHLFNLAIGKHELNLLRPKNALLLFGDILAKREDAQSALLLSYRYQNSSSKSNFKRILRIPIGANVISNAFLGISFPTSKEVQTSKLNYLLGTQNKLWIKFSSKGSVYENSHYIHTDKNYIQNIKFILPLKTEYEKTCTFINCEGRLQRTKSFKRFGYKAFTYTEYFNDLIPDHENMFRPILPKVFSSRASLHLQQFASKHGILKIVLTPLPSLFRNLYEHSQIGQSSSTLAKVNKINQQIIWEFNDLYNSSVQKNFKQNIM